MTVPKPYASTVYALADATRLLGREVVAGLLECSTSQIYKGCNPNAPHSLSWLRWDKVRMLVAVLRARGLPEYFSSALEVEAEYLAEGLRDGDGPESLDRLALRATAEAGDVMRVIADITDPDSDGGAAVTGAEAERAVKEIADAIAALEKIKREVVAQAAAFEASQRGGQRGGRR